MTRLYRALACLDADLQALRVRWALIGGLAVSARSEPRTTRDIDVAVAVDGDREAETLVGDLKARGYSLLPVHFEQDDRGRLSTVRLETPRNQETRDLVVDLLFSSSGIENEIVAAAELLELDPGLAIPVARVGHLLALKILAMRPERPQDAGDARALAQVATPAERQLARQAIDLIRARGYDRRRGEGLVRAIADVFEEAKSD